MIKIDDLYIKHYCHPNTAPYMNICRLPKEKAFSLAYKMAAENPGSTPFSRFANFENYYNKRMEVDEYLYNSFISLGGRPKETHPIFFVLYGSKSMEDWMGNWFAGEIKLKTIPSEFISFTLHDSIVYYRENGKLIMYTKETLSHVLSGYGAIEDFINELTKKYYCIEAQLWNDAYCVV